MVVAYGTATKSSFTGSASVIKAEEIEQTQKTNVLDALNGKSAGVQMFNASGQPGQTSPTIRIRGISSINAGNAPLIVLDGAPYAGDLNNLNPMDIESITVLKDAASTALYGSRAANGVIIVTTKQAKVGENAKISVDLKWGQNSRSTRRYETINDPALYYETYFQGLKNYAVNTKGMSADQAYIWANENLVDGGYGLQYGIYNVPQGQYLIGTNGSSRYLCSMFVQRKRNRSGSYSVIIKEKDSRTRANKVVKIIGTSSDEHELLEMERKAYEYIDSYRGPLLPMDYHDPLEDGIEKFLSGISNSHIQVIGPELIYGRLYDKIGYGELSNDMFRHLVICRLFNPGSKLRTVEYLRRYLNVDYDVETIYKFLDNLCYRKDKDCKKDGHGKPIRPEGDDIKTKVEQISFAYTKKICGDSISVVFYDMTTLYFEAAQEDDLRKTGFSKDGKHACPQIFLGLLVAPGGNPIGYEIYEGDIHEGKTLIPIVEALANKHGFDHYFYKT